MTKSRANRTFIYYIDSFTVVDGDTINAVLDIGLKLYTPVAVRINGIDAPELHGATAKQGKKVKDAVEWWVGQHPSPTMQIDSIDDKYGRLLGRVIGLNEWLLENKLVKPYDGGKKLPWTASDLAVVDAFVIPGTK